MNDLEHDLPARLAGLADELTGPDAGVSATAAIARHRRQRRALAGLVAAVATVVALLVAVPTVLGTASADRDRAAGPGVTSAPAPSEEEVAAEFAAAAAAVGGPVSLAAPPEWFAWPMGRPYPAATRAEDEATCPPLAGPLTAALGTEVAYWQGALPLAPSGCTWAPVPLTYSGTSHFAYVLDLGFDPDRTVEEVRSALETGADRSPVHGAQPCSSATHGGAGSVLIRCAGQDGDHDAAWTYLVPNAPGEGRGVWILSASARTDTGHTSAEALAVLVAAVREVYR